MCQNSEKSDDKTTLKQFPRITERFQSSREADLLLQKFQNKDFSMPLNLFNTGPAQIQKLL